MELFRLGGVQTFSAIAIRSAESQSNTLAIVYQSARPFTKDDGEVVVDENGRRLRRSKTAAKRSNSQRRSIFVRDAIGCGHGRCWPNLRGTVCSRMGEPRLPVGGSSARAWQGARTCPMGMQTGQGKSGRSRNLSIGPLTAVGCQASNRAPFHFCFAYLYVRLGPSCRPGLRNVTRSGVKDAGLRAPCRLVLDGGEHDDTLSSAGVRVLSEVCASSSCAGGCLTVGNEVRARPSAD